MLENKKSFPGCIEASISSPFSSQNQTIETLRPQIYTEYIEILKIIMTIACQITCYPAALTHGETHVEQNRM